MKTVRNPGRVERLMRDAIDAFELDLDGIHVLTEAASGNFAVTPLIAAMSGAPAVTAVTRDSGYGTARQVREYIDGWASRLGLGGRIEVTTDAPSSRASACQLVTNLGFVRPIDADFVRALPAGAAIALMWEPWEFRKEDLDIGACRARGIPVLGTCETDPRLNIFRYVGMVALKLLLEADIEVFRGRFVVIGSEPFAGETEAVLVANGAKVETVLVDDSWPDRVPALEPVIRGSDAVVLVEHRSRRTLVGGPEGVPMEWVSGGPAQIIHVCGGIDYVALDASGVDKQPAGRVEPGYMTVTTEYAGPRPVVDLHTAGLKVGEMLVRGLRGDGDPAAAERMAIDSGLALGIDCAG